MKLLSLAAPRDERALAVLETAGNDRRFCIRHNAHCYRFQANGRLDEYLAWLIRLQEDSSVLEPVPRDEALRKQEEFIRNLAILGSARQICEWSERRPGDLAAALVQLLDHPAAVVRRGAVRLIGVTAATAERAGRKPGGESLANELAYLFPESDSGRPNAGKQPKPHLPPSTVAAFLEKQNVRERLAKLCNHDPDRAVRAAARSTLDRLAHVQARP